MYVLGTGDDLDGLSAHIDLAHPHVIGVFVPFDGQDLSDHDVFDLVGEHGIALHLAAGESHVFRELPVGGVDADVLVKPFSG